MPCRVRGGAPLSSFPINDSGGGGGTVGGCWCSVFAFNRAKLFLQLLPLQNGSDLMTFNWCVLGSAETPYLNMEHWVTSLTGCITSRWSPFSGNI
jgi:hypothetical protein